MPTRRVLIATVLTAAAVCAQGPRVQIGGARPGHGPNHSGRLPGPAAIERFSQMDPAEREKVLEKLPPERRKAVEDRFNRYNSMSPEQKEQVRENYLRFQKLAPEDQDRARKAFRRFNGMPEDR